MMSPTRELTLQRFEPHPKSIDDFPSEVQTENYRNKRESRRTKAMQGDADAVSIDCGFGRGYAVVERPEVSQGAPLMAKTLGVLR